MNFDTTLRDSQGTAVEPVEPEKFDVEAYRDYEMCRLPRLEAFTKKKEGILVYRRVRAEGVFYDKCVNYHESLALQLGALQKSMSFEADVPNFLEPWYGIGYIAACFGGKYTWRPNQAPEVYPLFDSVTDLLAAPARPIAQTEEGKFILETIEYFLEKTRGQIPLSFSDVQSPLNMLGHLVSVNNLFMDIIDNPESVKQAALEVSELLSEFLRQQKALIGSALAKPGHGFASSRVFCGVGMSDDNSIMLNPDDYLTLFSQADEKIGRIGGGVGYHSCGNWSSRINMVQAIPAVVVVDGAFSAKTDPSPNEVERFAQQFEESCIVVNARAVGSAEEVLPIFRKLWGRGKKLIAVSYCKTVQEQHDLFHALHELDGQKEI